MKHPRALLLLVLLLCFSILFTARSAESAVPNMAWAPGTYVGRITIEAHVNYSEDPRSEGTVAEEYHLHLNQSTGRLQLVIGPPGNLASFRFAVPVTYSYTDWAEVEDYGSGGCLGQKSHAEGRGTVRLNRPRPDVTTLGDTFTLHGAAFQFGGFGAGIEYIGSNCPESNPRAMRSAHESGFEDIFSNPIIFEVLSPTANSMAGICTIPDWEYDPDNSFVCTWYVARVAARR